MCSVGCDGDDSVIDMSHLSSADEFSVLLPRSARERIGCVRLRRRRRHMEMLFEEMHRRNLIAFGKQQPAGRGEATVSSQ